MTAQNRVTNKGRFEDGDTPTGSDYADLIDSFLSLADTTAQASTSDISAPKLIATTEVSSPLIASTEVSASVGSFTIVQVTTVSAATVFADTFTGGNYTGTNATYTGTVSASAVNTDVFLGNTGTFTGTVSASAVQMGVLKLDVTTTVEASGGAGGSVPASVATFGEISVGGTTYRIALFNV